MTRRAREVQRHSREISQAVQDWMKHLYNTNPWFVVTSALCMLASATFLTFVLIMEDFLHQGQPHEPGFVVIELYCDFVICLAVGTLVIFRGPNYFRTNWGVFESTIAFLSLTTLYIYEATSRANEEMVEQGETGVVGQTGVAQPYQQPYQTYEERYSNEELGFLDFFRDIIRICRLVVFVRMLSRVAESFRVLHDELTHQIQMKFDSSNLPGQFSPESEPRVDDLEAYSHQYGGKNFQSTDEGIEMQMEQVVSLPEISISTRPMRTVSSVTTAGNGSGSNGIGGGSLSSNESVNKSNYQTIG
eukprot:g6226.t1